ncbi:MAG: radical SAM protein [bacterium]|nr:radical SAM protein [bacterium]
MAKWKKVFGPVVSRRLGISLGIDPIPYKTCNLDCIYCECGKTTRFVVDRQRFGDPQDILDQVREAIEENQHIDYITFSGSGEPTLNKDLGMLIRRIKEMTGIPVAVITNATLLHLKEVREELSAADIVLPSLDAVTAGTFERVDVPHNDLKLDTIIQGLKVFKKEFNGPLWLEVFLSKGMNDSKEDLDDLYRVIKEISPDLVQLNTLDRPPAYDSALPVDREVLEEIVEKWHDLPVEIVNRIKKRDEITAFSENLEKNILNTINRRPLTIEDLEVLTGKDRVELFKYIDILEKEKKVAARIVGDRIFYAPPYFENLRKQTSRRHKTG